MTFEKLKARYEAGRITIAMLKIYVKKGIITPEQFSIITGEEYDDSSSDNDILSILLGEEV